MAKVLKATHLQEKAASRAFFPCLLALLALAGLKTYFSSDIFEGTSGEPLERVVTPTVEQAPEPIAEQKTAKGENKRAAPAVPNNPTLYLTVLKLGIYGHTVRNDDSEFALELGAVKLPHTDFPWQTGDSNTYIACHRLGFPGTESYNQCLNLPFIQQGDEVTLADANGAVYRYRVAEMLVIGPDDGWITKPVPGRQVVSLQTCIEAPGDFSTLGPNWAARFMTRADRIA